MITAPAARRRATAAASRRGVRPAQSGEPNSVGMIAGVEDVLDAERDPVQRADGLAAPAMLVGSLGLTQGMLAIEERPGLDLRRPPRRCARGRPATSSDEVMRPSRMPAAASTRDERAQAHLRLVHGCARLTSMCRGNRATTRRSPERCRPRASERNTSKTNGNDPAENLIQPHRWRRHAFQIIGSHGHGRRIERGLDVERHENAEQDRIDPEVVDQRQEDRNEDDDDLGPFQRPAQQEDHDLRQQQEACIWGEVHVEKKNRSTSPPDRRAARIRTRRSMSRWSDSRPSLSRAPSGTRISFQHLEVQRPVRGRQQDAAERTDACGFRRRGQPEQDCAQDGNDENRKRKNDVSSAQITLENGMSVCSLGSFGQAPD